MTNYCNPYPYYFFFSFPVFCVVSHFHLSLLNNFYCDILHLYNSAIPFRNSVTVLIKLLIYKNHICELRSEELFKERSSQLYTQLMQLPKESLKKFRACTGFERPAPSWLVSSIGTVSCTGIAEVKGSNPVQALIFFRLSFCNCISCVYNCDDLPLNNSINDKFKTGLNHNSFR